MKKGRGLLRRCLQGLSLGGFLCLLGLDLPLELFLRMDPLAALLLPLALRDFIWALSPGLFIIALTLLCGRVFCGYICPLGVTLDLGGALAARFFGRPAWAARAALSPAWARGKYLFLALILGGAFAGVNLVFWGSPIALVTRFYVLLLHPVALLGAESALEASRPLTALLDLDALRYAAVTPRRFDSRYFLLIFFGALFVLEHLQPRFWCRCLCPAGALLGLCSRRPLLLRRTVGACSDCGLCAKHCPGGALDAVAPRACAHSECLLCRACARLCPAGETAFVRRALLPPAAPSPLPGRRAFIALAGCGALLSAAQYSGAHSLLRADSGGRFWPGPPLRPPGAPPEPEFLARCLRCGQCMKACPSNALQPAGLNQGLEGLFSPILLPRRGPCEPDCAACGRVCPSFAIRGLRLEEKQWAKVGTAVVIPGRCLAWSEGRRCVVCQEVCPYGAVSLARVEGLAAPAPRVRAAQCFGCGYCEKHCPVSLPAIIVEPLGALRLSTGSYRSAARAAGLSLSPGAAGSAPDIIIPQDELPPGFSE